MFRLFLFSFVLTLSQALPGIARESDVEIAAKRFRLQVYSTYRTTRTTYDQFIQTGDQVFELWKNNKSREAETAVRKWYARAEAASRQFGQPLPPLPVPQKRLEGWFDNNRSSNDNAKLKLSMEPLPLDRMIHWEQREMRSTEDSEADFTFFLQDAPLDPVNFESAVRSPDIRPNVVAAFIELPIENVDQSIDMNKLQARIESENLRLQLLEEQLRQVRSFDQLERVTYDFSRLIDNRRVTKMYWDTLNARERLMVPRLLDTKPVESRLARVTAANPKRDERE